MFLEIHPVGVLNVLLLLWGKSTLSKGLQDYTTKAGAWTERRSSSKGPKPVLKTPK